MARPDRVAVLGLSLSVTVFMPVLVDASGMNLSPRWHGARVLDYVTKPPSSMIGPDHYFS